MAKFFVSFVGSEGFTNKFGNACPLVTKGEYPTLDEIRELEEKITKECKYDQVMILSIHRVEDSK